MTPWIGAGEPEGAISAPPNHGSFKITSNSITAMMSVTLPCNQPPVMAIYYTYRKEEENMLADDLLVDKLLPASYGGMEPILRRIQAAQKFILSKEFAIAADGLVENIAELQKITPYCRVPYPATWIEWVHDDRPHWNPEGPYKARPIDPSRHQMAPQRVALLLEQRGDFAGSWKAHLFWSLKQKPTRADESQFNGSLGAVIMDTRRVDKFAEDPMVDALDSRVLADFGQEFVRKVQIRAPDVYDRLSEYAVEDWGGEIRFMIAMLGLLNARNVAHHEFIDKKTHNAKRAKHGKRPLFSHTMLKIRPQMMRASRGEGVGVAGSDRDLRRHFVIGHFKHRRTGLFWWNMHARGTLGFADKDYKVEG